VSNVVNPETTSTQIVLAALIFPPPERWMRILTTQVARGQLYTHPQVADSLSRITDGQDTAGSPSFQGVQNLARSNHESRRSRTREKDEDVGPILKKLSNRDLDRPKNMPRTSKYHRPVILSHYPLRTLSNNAYKRDFFECGNADPNYRPAGASNLRSRRTSRCGGIDHRSSNLTISFKHRFFDGRR
jgi:hypothetical protein